MPSPRAALDALIGGLDAAVEAGLAAAAERALEAARSAAKSDIGRSVKVRRLGRHAIELVTDAPGAQFVESGRGAVEATPGRALHFVDDTGREVFVTHVGPAAPKPFIAPARSALERDARPILERRIARLL